MLGRLKIKSATLFYLPCTAAIEKKICKTAFFLIRYFHEVFEVILKSCPGLDSLAQYKGDQSFLSRHYIYYLILQRVRKLQVDRLQSPKSLLFFVAQFGLKTVYLLVVESVGMSLLSQKNISQCKCHWPKIFSSKSRLAKKTWTQIRYSYKDCITIKITFK